MNNHDGRSRTSFPYLHELTAEECIELKRALCYPWETYRGGDGTVYHCPIPRGGESIDTDRQCFWFQIDVRHRDALDERARSVS